MDAREYKRETWTLISRYNNVTAQANMEHTLCLCILFIELMYNWQGVAGQNGQASVFNDQTVTNRNVTDSTLIGYRYIGLDLLLCPSSYPCGEQGAPVPPDQKIPYTCCSGCIIIIIILVVDAVVFVVNVDVVAVIDIIIISISISISIIIIVISSSSSSNSSSSCCCSSSSSISSIILYYIPFLLY